MELLEIDEIQAQAILDLQLRRLAALQRQAIVARLAELETTIADLEDILANEARQREIVKDELTDIVDKFGDDRRTQIMAADGDLSMEDLIPDEDACRLDHPRWLRQAHPLRRLSDAEARRQGREWRDPARRRRRPAPDGDHQPPLAAVLHHRRSGLPHQGLQPPRGAARREGRPRRRAAELPARRGHRPGPGDPRLRPAALPRARHSQRPGQEDPSRRLQLPAAGRRDRDQLPRGRRRADRRRAGRARRRHPARLPQGAGDPLPADDAQLRPMGRATSGVTGHEVPHGDDGAVDVGDPGRAGGGRGRRRGERRGRAPSTCSRSTSSR